MLLRARFLSFRAVVTRDSSMTATSDMSVRKSSGLANRYCAEASGSVWKEKPDMQMSQLLIPVSLLESLTNQLSG